MLTPSPLFAEKRLEETDNKGRRAKKSEKRGCNVLKTLRASLQRGGGDSSGRRVEADTYEVVAAITQHYASQLSLYQVLMRILGFLSISFRRFAFESLGR